MKGKYKSRLISKGNIFFMRLSTASFQLANVPFFVKDVRETALPERRADKLNGIKVISHFIRDCYIYLDCQSSYTVTLNIMLACVQRGGGGGGGLYTQAIRVLVLYLPLGR